MAGMEQHGIGSDPNVIAVSRPFMRARSPHMTRGGLFPAREGVSKQTKGEIAL
jgi:hypothetical protein